MNKVISGSMLLLSIGLSACATSDAVDTAAANTEAAASGKNNSWMDNDNIQTGSRLPSHGGHAINSTTGADYKNSTQNEASMTKNH